MPSLLLDEDEFDPIQFGASAEDQLAAQRVNEERAKEDPFLDIVGALISTEWIGGNLLTAQDSPSFEIPEEGFDFGNLSPEVHSQLFDGLDKELHGEYEGAVSQEHALHIRKRLDVLQSNQDMLNRQGGAIIPLQLAAALLDPTAIAAVALTEGTVAPLVIGNKASRIARILGSAAEGGVINAATEAALVSSNPYRDESDVAIAALAGITLGGAFGSLGRGPKSDNNRDIAMAARKVQQELEAERAARLEGSTPTSGGLSADLAKNGEDLFQRPTDDEAVRIWDQTRVNSTNKATDTERNLKVLLPSVRNAGDEAGGAGLPGISIWDQLAGSAHSGVSSISRVIGLNPSGAGRIQGETILESKDMLRQQLMTARGQSHYEPAREWRKARFKELIKTGDVKGAMKFHAINTFGARREYMKAVADAKVSGRTNDPWVKKGVEAEIKFYNDALEALKRDGVEGAEEIITDAQYLPRVWNRDALVEAERKFRSPIIQRSISKAIQAVNKDLSFEQADAAAYAVRKSISQGIIRQRTSGGRTSTDNKEKLKQAIRAIFRDEDNLKEAGINPSKFDEDAILSDDMLDSVISIAEDSDPKSLPSRLRQRVKLDEMYEENIVTGVDANGQDIVETFRLRDIFERDLDTLAERYADTMTGHAALARHGFRSTAAVDRIFEKLEGTKARYSKDDESLARIDDDIDELDRVFRYIWGAPVNPKEGEGLSTLQRRWRDVQFIRVMGQSGLASIQEIGNVMGQATFKAFLQSMPAFKSLWARAADGKIPDQVVDQLEAAFGVGNDRLLNIPLAGRFESGAAEDGTFSNVDRILRTGTRIVADVSLLAPVTQMLERMASRTIVQNFANAAAGKKTNLNGERLKMLGLDQKDLDVIMEQMRQNVTDVDGALTGKRVKSLNLDGWDDQDAARKFVLAVRRHTRTAVQRNDFTDMAPFMTTSVGKTLWQFRSFISVAYAKQFQRGINTRDAQVFTSWAMASFLAGGVYMAQTAINTPLSDTERRKYLKERFTAGKVGAAMFSRAGYASFFPQLIDTALWGFGQDPWFSFTRSTGMSTNFFGGAPVVDHLQKLTDFGKALGSSALSDERQLSRNDVRQGARALLPSRIFFIQQGIDAVTADLPESTRQ